MAQQETTLYFRAPSRQTLQDVLTSLATINARPISPALLGSEYDGRPIDTGGAQIVAAECDDTEKRLTIIIQPTKYLPKHHRDMYSRHHWRWLERLSPYEKGAE